MFTLRTFPVWIILLLLSGMFLAGWNGQQAIKDTGQDKCFDNTGEIACPSPGEPFYGQDAQYAVGCQSNFTDNGDGTVTDNCTGLVWQQEDDGITRLWSDALTYCQDLDLAGSTDWRLPNIRELHSIVNYGKSEPAIDITFFPEIKPADYSSSTSKVSDPRYNLSVEFGQGLIYLYGKAGHRSFVRCVQ